jgi:hypothetical protein
MIEPECKWILHTVQAKAQHIVTKVTYALYSHSGWGVSYVAFDPEGGEVEDRLQALKVVLG